MPSAIFPDERTHVRSLTRTINGQDVEFHIYAERYSMWFGLVSWNARHIRAEVPYTDGKRTLVEFVHSRKEEPVIRDNPLPDERAHLSELEADVSTHIQKQTDLAREVECPGLAA